jgi:hypothetical protein
MAREWLDSELAKVPQAEQARHVEGLLARMPQERANLELKVAEAKKAQARGDRTGPPAHSLRKGFASFEYRAEALQEWLARHKVSGTSGSALTRRHIGGLCLLTAAVLLGLRRFLASGRNQ